MEPEPRIKTVLVIRDHINSESSVPKRRRISKEITNDQKQSFNNYNNHNCMTIRKTVIVDLTKNKKKVKSNAMLNQQVNKDNSCETSGDTNKNSAYEAESLTTEEVLLATPTVICSTQKREPEKVHSQVLLFKQSSFGKQSENNKLKVTTEQACYRDLSEIGNGAYGTVYKAKDLTNGQYVALKKVRIPITEDGLPISTIREIATLKQLERFEHPYIVKLLDVCHGNGNEVPNLDDDITNSSKRQSLTLWLVFEHIEQDLTSFIESRNGVPIPTELSRQMMKEILLATDFLHSHRIIHRDLKPQNLLVTSEGRIKVADFGLAKTYDFEMRLTSVVVTLWYRAPEVLLGCTYATPVDIWSIGCIMAEIYRLKPLFPGSSEGDQLNRIFQVIGTPSQSEWPDNVPLSSTAFPRRLPRQLDTIISNLCNEGIDLIRSILTFDPRKRISAARALEHSYFQNNNCAQ